MGSDGSHFPRMVATAASTDQDRPAARPSGAARGPREKARWSPSNSDGGRRQDATAVTRALNEAKKSPDGRPDGRARSSGRRGR